MQDYIFSGFMDEIEKTANKIKPLINLFKGRKIITGKAIYGSPKAHTWKDLPKKIKAETFSGKKPLSETARKALAKAPNVTGRPYITQ